MSSSSSSSRYRYLLISFALTEAIALLGQRATAPGPPEKVVQSKLLAIGAIPYGDGKTWATLQDPEGRFGLRLFLAARTHSRAVRYGLDDGVASLSLADMNRGGRAGGLGQTRVLQQHPLSLIRYAEGPEIGNRVLPAVPRPVPFMKLPFRERMAWERTIAKFEEDPLSDEELDAAFGILSCCSWSSWRGDHDWSGRAGRAACPGGPFTAARVWFLTLSADRDLLGEEQYRKLRRRFALPDIDVLPAVFKNVAEFAGRVGGTAS